MDWRPVAADQEVDCQEGRCCYSSAGAVGGSSASGCCCWRCCCRCCCWCCRGDRQPQPQRRRRLGSTTSVAAAAAERGDGDDSDCKTEDRGSKLVNRWPQVRAPGADALASAVISANNAHQEDYRGHRDKSVHRLAHGKNKNTNERGPRSFVAPPTLCRMLLFLRNSRQQRPRRTMDKILTKHKSRILLRIVSFFANCQFQLRRTYCDTLLLQPLPTFPLPMIEGRRAL